MLSLNEMILGYIMFSLNPMYVIMIILYYFNVKYYIITDKELATSIVKKISTTIIAPCVKHSNGKDLPTGYFIGRTFIGYIDNVSHEYILYLLTTPFNYTELIKNSDIVLQRDIPKEIKETCEVKKIMVYIRKGSYKNFYYNSIKLDMSHISPLGDQYMVVSNIIKIYNRENRATIFIHGNTSTGKSSIGYLLAKHLNGIYCHTFNPCDPGDYLSNFMVEVTRDDEPIIIVIEEADCIIRSIENQTIQKHPDIPMSIYNKSTWTTFLDDLVFYKNVILILTSNTPKQEIDDLDDAYLRDGRIHASYSMNTRVQSFIPC